MFGTCSGPCPITTARPRTRLPSAMLTCQVARCSSYSAPVISAPNLMCGRIPYLSTQCSMYPRISCHGANSRLQSAFGSKE